MLDFQNGRIMKKIQGIRPFLHFKHPQQTQQAELSNLEEAQRG